MVFYWQLRELLAGGAGARSLATMAFGGALLFAASGTMSAGIDWAMQDQAHHASGATEQTLSAMAST